MDHQYPLYFCFEADVSPEGSDYVLGATFMVNKDTVFTENSILLYPRSNCGGKNLAQVMATNQQNMVGVPTASKQSAYQNKMIWLMVGGMIMTLTVIGNLSPIKDWQYAFTGSR